MSRKPKAPPAAERESVRCEAPDCKVDFVPKRSTARYCTTTCRSRAARSRKAAEDNAAEETKTGTDAEHELVRAVRLELDKAKATMTVAGQLALQVARRIANPETSGISALSKELRELLAEACGPAQPVNSGPPPKVEEDEVDKARRRREEKAARAAEKS
ncbi:MAG: hypothetical protein ACRDS9_27300 [Pseudonocardiaceae bacterium]